MALNLTIVTPHGNFFEGTCDSVTMSTIQGQITVLENHAPLVAPLDYCELYIMNGGQKRRCALGGGVVYIDESGARVITDSIVDANDIDLAKAKRDKDEAEKRIQCAKNNIEKQLIEKELARAINEIRIRK